MAPDINSLPPSGFGPRSTANPSNMSANDSENTLAASGDGTPSPRSPSVSLQAAATLNAGLQRGEPSRRTSNGSFSRRRQSSGASRRRSQILMNLQIADPTIPSPGEMVHDYNDAAGRGHYAASPQRFAGSPLMTTADPHHSRTPSLGELHQKLEEEQEFQTNRLWQELTRQRQLNLQLMQAQGQGQGGQSTSAVPSDDVSERGIPIPAATPTSAPLSAMHSHHSQRSHSSSFSRSPGFPRRSLDMARADLHRRSRTPSRNASPSLHAVTMGGEPGEPWALGGRDETAFYQAETQMLTRENQMLRHRIQELERQLRETTGIPVSASPSQASQLNRSTSISENEPSSARAALGRSTAALPPATTMPRDG